MLVAWSTMSTFGGGCGSGSKIELGIATQVLAEKWRLDVWSRLQTQACGKLGERSSIAVGLARIANGSLETNKKWQRKAVRAKVDILFKVGNNEFGSCAIERDTVTVANDKYMDDGLAKLPKTLRDMLCMLLNQYPRQINNL